MALCCFVGLREVFAHGIGSEVGPGGKTSTVDCFEPCGFRWIACARVEVFYDLGSGWELIHIGDGLLGAFVEKEVLRRFWVAFRTECTHQRLLGLSHHPRSTASLDTVMVRLSLSQIRTSVGVRTVT